MWIKFECGYCLMCASVCLGFGLKLMRFLLLQRMKKWELNRKRFFANEINNNFARKKKFNILFSFILSHVSIHGIYFDYIIQKGTKKTAPKSAVNQ